jgi:hypothetical protein
LGEAAGVSAIARARGRVCAHVRMGCLCSVRQRATRWGACRDVWQLLCVAWRVCAGACCVHACTHARVGRSAHACTLLACADHCSCVLGCCHALVMRSGSTAVCLCRVHAASLQACPAGRTGLLLVVCLTQACSAGRAGLFGVV